MLSILCSYKNLAFPDFCSYIKAVKITFDPIKRDAALEERGLDFAEAELVFTGRTFSQPDDRFDYGEPRTVTAGYLRNRMVVIVWTPRGDARHVISMRYCHAKEERNWREQMG
jgi:uncharacterized DUF497 family protein